MINNCVYKIKFNKHPEFYIGSTVYFENRKSSHLKALRSNKHKNKYLQNLYNKYGEKDITFKVLEKSIDEDILRTREQFYIDTLNPKINVYRKVQHIYKKGNTLETKIKISNSLKNYHKLKGHSEETRAKIAKSLKGRFQSKETIEKRKLSNKQSWQKKNINSPFSKKLIEVKRLHNSNLRQLILDRNARIVHDLKLGIKQVDAARKYKVSPSLITKLKKINKIETIKTIVRGSSNGFSKLNEIQVLKIKLLLKSKITHKNIAAQFNVGKSTISAIASGQNWSHLKLENNDL